MKHSNVIIVGGGPAGRIIVHMLHQSNKNLSVTLIKDEQINANRCAVPYGIDPSKPAEKFFIPNKLVTDFGADLVIDQVTAIDTSKSHLATRNGSEFSYDHLVLATGARPIMPPIAGSDAKNIVAVRSKDDMLMLREASQHFKKFVVVGGGYIGVEVAVVLRTLGLDVTIVEMLPHTLATTTETEFVSAAEEDLRNNGIEIITNAKVTEFCSHDGNVSGVQLEDGHTLDADFVVMSVGVLPNTELATEAGIQASRLGFITDEFLRTNVSNIYASGDCAEKKSFITGKPTRGEFGTNAVFMSRVVGANILGHNRRFPGVLNANATTAFHTSFGSAGLLEKMARDEGLDIVTGYSEVMSKYPMMDDVSHIKTKLVFERSSGKLVGGSVLRKDLSTAHNIDFISLAIQMGATAEDLLHYQYATHPELAAKPSDNMYVFAARDALKKL